MIDQDLPNNKAEAIVSRLQQMMFVHLPASDARTSFYRDRHKDVIPFFDHKGGISVGNNNCVLMSAININYNTNV